jgi:hypothetical protein
MIDIKNKRCIYENCNKIPIFNYEGEIKALYCNEHKLENMIDILKINVDDEPLNILGSKMISLTFQYKELNKDVYDLLLQNQVETYIAN